MKNLLCFLLLIPALTCAQGDASNWFFGMKAGIKFSGTNVQPLFNAQLNTIEGCSAASDSQGNLLFYTNGLTVWNKFHQVMANGSGLFGDISSSQAAVIVPKPGSTTNYFIFTSNPWEYNGGFRYSEVDMSLNNGNGAVTAKNVLVYEPTCEKISIVRHANGQDYWIATHVYGSDEFRVYLLNSNGLSTTPVSSFAGIVVEVDDDKANAIGYLKFSPDGSKIAACHTYLMLAELFDFDSATGIVSNARTISDDGLHVYGVEFSTHSNALYISAVDEKKLIQFDLAAEDIAASRTDIGFFLDYPGALQLAPNGTICLAMAENDKVSVIANPSIIGTACGLQENAINLQGRMCMLGLPSFDQSQFDARIIAENSCAGSPVGFSVESVVGPQSITWNFGDGETATGNAVSHTFSASGNYIVTASLHSSVTTMVISRMITVHSAPIAGQVQNQVRCIASGEGYALSQNDASVKNGQQQCSVSYYATADDAQNLQNPLINIQPLNAGTVTFYAVLTNTAGCSATTSFTVTSAFQPGAATPTDYLVCEDIPYDGVESFDLHLKDEEILGGQDSSLFTVTYHTSQSDALLGQNEIIGIYNNTQASEKVYARVQAIGATCFATTELRISVIPQPKGTENIAIVTCEDNTTDGIATFSLHDNDAAVVGSLPQPDFVVSYHLTVEDAQNNAYPLENEFTNDTNGQLIFARVQHVAGGCATVTQVQLVVKECGNGPGIEVSELTFPKHFTPDGDGINDMWKASGNDVQRTKFTISIFDRNGRIITRLNNGGTGWDGTFNGTPMPETDYWFVVEWADGKSQRGHFSLLR